MTLAQMLLLIGVEIPKELPPGYGQPAAPEEWADWSSSDMMIVKEVMPNG